MAEKNCLDVTKLSFHYHVCHCGAVVRELLAPTDKPGSTPGDAVFCFFVPFFSLLSLFNTTFADPAGHTLGSVYI